ncbi:MAG: prepilin-type N-terminal cleavage/methylation domain-containing protein [Pirellulaceae bacterium]
MSPRSMRGSRSAFTLLEIILVLSVVVIFASIAAPTFLRTLGSQNLVKACDLVRSEMARARVKAIKTGKVYVLLASPDTNRIVVAELDQIQSAMDSTGANSGAAILPMVICLKVSNSFLVKRANKSLQLHAFVRGHR